MMSCDTAVYSRSRFVKKCRKEELEANSKLCETLIRHIQNPAIFRTVNSDIIQTYSEPCVALVYAEI